MASNDIKRALIGLFVGGLSTVFIRELLESMLGLAGIATAYYAFAIGIIALLGLGLVQNWKLYQVSIALGAALLGAVAGLVLLLSLVSA